jgi:hypothetical protein
MIPPLRKKAIEGHLYTRRAEVETKLGELAALPLDALVERCQLRSTAAYVPSECLLHFVRSLRSELDTPHFERLYSLLLERVVRKLPSVKASGGESPTQSRIREAVIDRFVELVAKDRLTYAEVLDYYEVQFDAAVHKLRLSAQKQAWQRENPNVGLEEEGGPGILSVEVEDALRDSNSADFDFDDYRSGLDKAIDTLPPLQARVIEMIRQGIPIDSQDPTEVTIAGTLNRSEKTIRTQRNLAYATLRKLLLPGGTP